MVVVVVVVAVVVVVVVVVVVAVVVVVVVGGGGAVQKDGNGALAPRARTIWIWKGARCTKMETVRWRPGRAAF